MCKFIFLTLISFLLIVGQKTVAQEVILKVMTYNIYHGENPYSEGSPTILNIAELINKHQLDVVFLQEVDSMTLRSQSMYGSKVDFMESLGQETNMYSHFAKAINFSEGGYGGGILTKQPAKFTSVILPTPYGGESRSVALATIIIQDSIKISFAGTHLCHEFEKNRLEQVKAIIISFEHDPIPSIVGGDFNFTEDEFGYSLMTSTYQDVGMIMNKKSSTYSTENPEIRIDYIWVDKKSNWKILDYKVLDARFSDHLPVIATLQLIK